MTPREGVAARVLYDNGLGWEIIEDSKCTIGIAPAEELMGRDAQPVFMLFIENKSSAEQLFRPEQIFASARGKRAPILGQRELKYIALQTRESEKWAGVLTAALAGVAVASSGNRTTTVYGSRGPVIVAKTTDPGATAAGAIIAGDRAAQSALNAEAKYQFSVSASQTFVATNTLLPGQYYGGLFIISGYRRDEDQETIDIGVASCGETKQFSFTAAAADAPEGMRQTQKRWANSPQ